MRDGQRKIAFRGFGLLLAVLMLLALLRGRYDLLNFSGFQELDTGWHVEVLEDHTLRLSRAIDSVVSGKCIMFYSADSYVNAYIGNRQIFSYGSNVPFCQSPGSLWQFIEVPSSVINYGKTITIDIRTVYPERFKKNVTTYVGSSGGLLVSKMAHELPDSLLNLLFIIYGVSLLVIYRIERSSGVEKESDFVLGMLCIVAFFWSSCDLLTFQLIFPSGVGQYFLYYTCFMLLPFFVIWYTETRTGVRVTPVMYFHIGLSVIFILLQMTGIFEFTQTLYLVLPIFLLEVIVAGWYQIRHSRITLPRINQIALAVFILLAIANSMLYLTDIRSKPSLLMVKMGFFIYVTFNAYVTFEHLVNNILKISENEKMRDIAYMDQLTQIGNRYAFMRDLESVDYHYIGLVSFDLNNLKYYNDSLGHIRGDELIRTAAEILKKVYEGSLYRTGGDEFVSIVTGRSMADLEQLRRQLNERTRAYNADAAHELIIEIACGFSIYQDGDDSYEDILSRADAAMYENKRSLKEQSALRGMTVRR